MRVIKFRAWDKQGRHMLNNLNGNCGYEELCLMDTLDSDYHEVMQFTGLLTTDNKEIYEGDILRFEDKERETGDTVEVKYTIDELKKLKDRIPFWKIVRVIGNRYENPELLK